MKKLESKFIEINTDEIIEFLDKPITSFTKKDLSSPEISFYDNNFIEEGRYDFEVNGLFFTSCWIEPVERDENGRYKYCSGSYYVIKNS
ncbi:MAG TPA: hypothetical protein GX708_15715 [Gallicola sp.]|nr:hypothetical protein [Gallicola sp.]